MISASKDSLANNQQEIKGKENASFLELLILLTLGAVSMSITIFGLNINDPVIYAIGLTLSIAVTITAVVRCIQALWDLAERIIRHIKK